MRALNHWICVVLMVLGLLGSGFASACEPGRPPLRIALFDFAPYYSLDPQGKPVGSLIDKVDQVLSEVGCRWQGTFYRAPEVLTKLIGGYADMVAIVTHPIVEGRGRYIEPPIDQWHVNSYRKPGMPAVDTLEQLQRQKVIVLRGYGYGGIFPKLIEPEREVKLLIVNDIKQGLRTLEANPDAYLLGYQQVTEAVIDELGLSDIHASHLDSIKVYLMLSPQLQEPALIDKLEQAVARRYSN